MADQTIRIRGTQGNPMAGQQGLLVPKYRLFPGTARDGATQEIDAPGASPVRVELENGFALWTRLDDLSREYGTPPARGSGDAWEITRLTPRRATGTERGLIGLAIKVLDLFDISIVKTAASKLGKTLEERQLDGRQTGLHRLGLGGEFAMKAVPRDEILPADRGPLLIFLHGTASSTKGSFGELWERNNDEGSRLRQAMTPLYGNRVFALEHRTLTESPIRNAIDLVERLPHDAELHLVSHSRGGLIGELIALAGCERLREVLTELEIERLFAVDRSIAPKLGLAPLTDEQLEAYATAYAHDRALLLELVKQLAAKRPRLTRFVRVACPARGTTLASGRLDRWLSVLNHLIGAASGEGLAADGFEFLAAVVKERTDPRTLPGLEAMVPGSGLTRLLNGSPELTSAADLTVIAGDIEGGGGLWHTLKVLASDWFYRNEHDLVVDTASMAGGLARLPDTARQRTDQGAKVSHFSYFSNAQSVRWLKAGLTRRDGEHGGFLPIAAAPPNTPRCVAAVARSRSSGKPQPIVVVLPGTMGSQLRADDDTIWLNYLALLKGGLKRIAMDRDAIAPIALVDQFYGPLVEFLARTHQVELFPYDWRHSVRKAAVRLAETLTPLVAQAEKTAQPLRIVAHSMGGLVVRAMIADGGPGTALWQRIVRLPGARFLMLGTPNLGSYEAVRWLTGDNPTQAKLSLLDVTQGTDQIVGLVARYPGLLELLPFAPDDPDFTEPSRWEKLKAELGADWNTARAADLAEAGATWKLLRAARPDPRFMAYVAGCQPATVVDYRVAENKGWSFSRRKILEYIATAEGDGTVTWQSGCLPGVPTWYAEDTAHDALCAQPRAFPGYLDILLNGQTSRLPVAPPARSRAVGGEERFVLPPAAPVDSMPAPDDLGDFSFSGQPLRRDESEKPPVAPIEIAIRHGNLAYARYPVLVGHYHGDTVVSAEAVLDRQLGGALTRRLDLGIYPGALNTNAVFINDSAAAKPAGAVVVGLGQVGGLSPGLLEQSARAALLEFALAVAAWPDRRFGETGKARSAALSCLLVGTGAGALPLGDALEAILRAAVQANQRLAELKLDDKVVIDRLEFLELYEDVALAAVDALNDVLRNRKLADAVRWTERTVEPGQGGRRRLRFNEAPEWYQRVEIVEAHGCLRFVFSTDRARAEESLATGQLALVRHLIQIASRDTGQNPEVAKTLFEMLLPLRLREMAPQQRNLVILVDQKTAAYPWELICNRWGNDERPPSVAAGYIRQFKTREYRQQPVHGQGNTALVIGNPDLGDSPEFCDLPGAEAEARAVVEQLTAAGYDTTDRIRATATPIMEALHKESWRILHLAGHGVHEHRVGEEKIFSGMVIGQGAFLGTGDVAQMRYVPELVFINCCHLGRVDGGRPLDVLGLAANLGEEFIRMGVKAVIAAGWAVDDAAGKLFAERFYAAMLAGATFGEGVRGAREAVWDMYGETVNTWGAYQCYGDPAYRLKRGSGGPSLAPRDFGAAHELVAELENIAADLTAGSDPEKGREQVQKLLARIPASRRDDWLAQASVCGALGLVWGELGEWEAATKQLDTALRAEKADCPIRVLEQRANFRVRLAAARWRERRKTKGDQEPLRATQIAIIDEAIGELGLLCRADVSATAERYNLLAGAYKRLAMVVPDGNRRLEAIVNMTEHYRLAAATKREAGKRDAYAFTNWVAGSLIALQRGDTKGLDLADATRELQALHEQTAGQSVYHPDFWASASLADLALTSLMLAPGQSASVGEAAASIKAGYLEAIRRASSPRQIGTLHEHFEFLIELWSEKDKKMLEVLKSIREVLQ